MQDIRGLVGACTGAGEGIGRAMVLTLAGAGMNVAVLDINAAAADGTAAECAKAGVKAIGVRCDVTVPADLAAAAAQIESGLGQINLLWAHAGVGLAADEGFLTAARDAIRWMYAVNVDGVVDTVRTFVPAMKQHRGWRHVGITASMAGLVQCVPDGPATYSASKYATVGIAEALRVELQPFGIGVTLFCPGTTNTLMWDSARNRQPGYGGPRRLPSEAGERLRTTGMDVAEVAAFAVDAARSGRFYAVMPDTAARARRIEERCRNITQAIHLPKRERGGLSDGNQ
jgi:NAD(P)-dependent dehydrogenase (short-subunit alcohol dehydrogenase family)